MEQRIVKLQISNEYIHGSGVSIGAAGSHDDVLLEMDFRPSSVWAGTTRRAIFANALGENRTVIVLTTNLLEEGQGEIYLVPVPQEAKDVAGECFLTVEGFVTDVNGKEIVRCVTEEARFRVLPSKLYTNDTDSVTPSQAEQLQAEIDDLKPKIILAGQVAENEEERIKAEQARAEAEGLRASAETLRSEEEDLRSKAEESRDKAEQLRASAETLREKAEDARVKAETARADENSGIVAQATQKANEASESARLAAQAMLGQIPDGTFQEIKLEEALRRKINLVQTTVNVRYFGAVGDGETDDTAAIQAAIDYAQTSGIRDVYFPAGMYKITAPLIVTTATGTISGISGATSRYYFGIGLRLRGDISGTTIIRKEGTGTAAITRGSDTYTVDTIIGIQGEGTGFWASDLTMENASPNECYAVYSLRARTNLERCNIATPSHGIYIYGWTNTISDVVIHAAEKAIWIENATSTVLNKVYCHGNNPYCISSYYSTLISCCGDGCTGRMFQLEGTVTMVGCGGESEGVENYLYLTGYNTNVIVDGFTFNRQSANGAVFAYIAQGATCGTHLDMRGMRASEKEGAAGANMYWLDFATGVVFSAFIGSYTKGRDGNYDWKNEPKISKSATGAGQIIRLAIGDYFGSYKVNKVGSDFQLARTDKTVLNDGSVTPVKTTFIEPADGEYTETPNFANLLTSWTAGEINSSGAVESSSTVKYSNQIAVTSGQTVRLRGLGWGAASSWPLACYFYDASGNFIARRNTTNMTTEDNASAGRWNYSYDVETDTVEFKVASTFSSYNFSNTAYIVVSTRNANATNAAIATVNQPILYQYVWSGDPMHLGDEVKVKWGNIEDKPGNIATEESVSMAIDNAIDGMIVTPEKTTFIDPASNGEYVQTPLFDNLLTTWTAGQIGSTGAVASSSTVKYSNHIPVASGQTVRVRGLGWGASAGFPLAAYFYDASGNFIARRNTTNMTNEDNASAGRWNFSYDSETDTVEFKVASTFSSYNFSNTAYIIVVTRNANAKGTEIATVNQEIKYKQLWTGDPQQLNSAVKVPGSSLILKAPNGGKYRLAVDNSGALSTEVYDGN